MQKGKDLLHGGFLIECDTLSCAYYMWSTELGLHDMQHNNDSAGQSAVVVRMDQLQKDLIV